MSERQLFEALYRRMAALAGPDSPDLDDLVQVAAEQVFKSRASFRGESELPTWIYAICYRILLKHRRWYRRWSLRFRLEHEGDPIVPDPQLPSEDLERRERARTLQAGLDRLSEQHRAVVVLHDLEEISVRDIAAIVDCNELTVRSRLRDGRRKLRELLEAEQARSIGGQRALRPS